MWVCGAVVTGRRCGSGYVRDVVVGQRVAVVRAAMWRWRVLG